MKMKNQLGYIYCLVDPRDSSICYVGQTNNPNQRLKGHLSKARHSTDKSDLLLWLRSVLADDMQPQMVLLEEVSSSELDERERHWINLLSQSGANITNLANKGVRHQRYRKQYRFWLDLTDADELSLSQQIQELKTNRVFQKTLLNGIRLMLDLHNMKTNVLFELFPWVKGK